MSSSSTQSLSARRASLGVARTLVGVLAVEDEVEALVRDEVVEPLHRSLGGAGLEADQGVDVELLLLVLDAGVEAAGEAAVLDAALVVDVVGPVDGELPAVPALALGHQRLEHEAVELGHPPELEVHALAAVPGEPPVVRSSCFWKSSSMPGQADAALGQVLGAERVALVGGHLEIDPALVGELRRHRGEDGDGDDHHQQRDAALRSLRGGCASEPRDLGVEDDAGLGHVAHLVSGLVDRRRSIASPAPGGWTSSRGAGCPTRPPSPSCPSPSRRSRSASRPRPARPRVPPRSIRSSSEGFSRRIRFAAVLPVRARWWTW